MCVWKRHRNPPNARLITSLAGVSFWQFLVLNPSRNNGRATRRNTAQHRIPRKACLKGQSDWFVFSKIAVCKKIPADADVSTASTGLSFSE